MVARIRQWLGIGGVNLQLIVDTNIPKDANQIIGKVLLTSKSDQHVLGITIKIFSSHQERHNNSTTTHRHELGRVQLNENFDIKPSEMKEIPFILTCQNPEGFLSTLRGMGGVMGALGNIVSVLDNHRYYVEASANVKGTALQPNRSVQVRFV